MTITPIQEQRSRLLDWTAMGFVGLAVAIAISDIVSWATLPGAAATYATDLAITIVMALSVIGIRYLAHHGRFEVAAWMLICILAARMAITVGVIVPEKLHLLAPGYLLVIILAQVLLGAWGGLIAGFASLPMFALAYAQKDPRLHEEFAAITMFSLIVYVTVAGFVQLTLGHMNQALRRQNVLLMDNQRARVELQDRAEQFRAITETSPTGIVIQQDGHIVYANPQFAEMARCVQDDVYGLSLWELFDPEHADRLRAQIVRRRDPDGALTRSDQVVFRPLKGPPLWCEVAVVDATYRDREATVGTVLDVSDRVQAQMEVRRERDFTSNIISAADAIIMVLDPAGNVVRLNPAGERITGYTEEELLGRPYWETLMPPERREAAQHLVAGVAEGTSRGHLEEPWTTKHGEARDIDWRYVAQLSPEGSVIHIIVVGIDVTQQRMLEKQSIAAERLRALGQMAGGVAHDLNNTLAGILGPAELLLLDEMPEERRQELSTIVAAAKRGSATVKRIQRFSQARTDMDRQVFNLRELAGDVINTLRPRWRDQAQREGLTINVSSEIEDDMMVVGSSGEVGNVLTNLIVNACEAMPEGGTITVRGQQEDNGMTVFSVTDTGVGMSEEMRRDIFEPFFSTKGADNSGLGLAVIRGIILRHGGNIKVDSTVGEGTVFTVSLPSAQGVEPEAEKVEPAATTRGPLSVLVVDDSKPIADFAGVALGKMGHHPTTAYDGLEALEHLREAPFDVLLTDYGMEGLSGINLAREAKALRPQIKTVIMTGWDFSADEFEDIDAALAKPFTMGELGELLNEKLFR